jgi:ribonucleoside-diphosphate reductase alpha chain
VRADEWPAVADFIWQHRAEFTGVTLLGDEATRSYAQPPLQTVVTDSDVARWNQLRYQPVHYAASKPASANHESIDTEACTTGACEG